MTKDHIESFLLRLENNEEQVIEFFQDYLLFPILPFFQLVHIVNTEEIMEALANIDKTFDSMMIRVDGYLTAVISENNYQEKELINMVIHILQIMRF
ncbi:hypothetical protein [Photorhabdus heterorhabditis]|uniref:Uncharacterized protein n=1 Tax=Photorhabdus heterorhabditis TaxID=880156 RepID=A0A5B0X807_9GAMM|nr:hypothetical protein [Photorhabdus heterorhabditis]KAA1195504.1 hypothetical protein F0L16_02140 [Photorhabdus heterorhabditis]KOY62986.1 hypothetical protein AM629_05360 [Photorhabdus heterorhabditis]MBS9441031.1 hypothetical protein [Photorhabdus heterorhabditis]